MPKRPRAQGCKIKASDGTAKSRPSKSNQQSKQSRPNKKIQGQLKNWRIILLCLAHGRSLFNLLLTRASQISILSNLQPLAGSLYWSQDWLPEQPSNRSKDLAKTKITYSIITISKKLPEALTNSKSLADLAGFTDRFSCSSPTSHFIAFRSLTASFSL